MNEIGHHRYASDVMVPDDSGKSALKGLKSAVPKFTRQPSE